MNTKLLRTLIELAKRSKGVALNTDGVIINPETGKRFPKAYSSIRHLEAAADKRGKFFSILANGSKEELRGPLEAVVENADFSEWKLDTSKFVVRQYPKVSKSCLDFRGVYDGVFAFFHRGVYHEIDLIAPDSVRKVAELKRNAMGDPTLADAIRKHQTHYTDGYLVIALPANKGLKDAKDIETKLKAVIDYYDMGDDFKVERDGYVVTCKPTLLVDCMTENTKYGAVKLGGALAFDYTGKDYTVTDIIYVTKGITDESKKELLNISVMAFDVDDNYSNTPQFQEGTPPIVAVRSGEQGMYYAKCSLSLANGVGDLVYSRLADNEGAPGLINGLPLDVALEAMASLKQTGESLRDLPPEVIANRLSVYRIRHEQGAPIQ